MRVFILLLLFLLSSFCTNAQTTEDGEDVSYRIKNVYFVSLGKTKAQALETSIFYSRNKIITTNEELEIYIDSIVQQVKNTRLFDDVKFSYSIEENDESFMKYVDLTIIVSDSYHLIIFPKPSYNSNRGFSIKLKGEDTNFIGLMEPLGISIGGGLGSYDYPWPKSSSAPFFIGADFSYNFPFSLGFTEDIWSNNISFEYIFGEKTLEYQATTGLTAGIPFSENNEIDFYINQSFSKDSDYAQYGDSTWFTENVGIKVPLVLAVVDINTPVVYTPILDFKYNWDFDSIAVLNDDLISPVWKIGHNILIKNVNFKGNFRDGYYFDFGQYVKFNSAKKSISPSLEFETKLYKAFNNFGLCFDFYAYAMLNGKQNAIGERLRGTLDKQYVKVQNESSSYSQYALDAPVAFMLSIDVPFHILTTNWYALGYSLFGPFCALPKFIQILTFIPHKAFAYLDFELQIAPFVDIGFVKNSSPQNNVSLEKGLYNCGVEFLVYPLKWKSIVVRLSCGLDLGATLLSDVVDTSWRSFSSPYEIQFGLGFQY